MNTTPFKKLSAYNSWDPDVMSELEMEAWLSDWRGYNDSRTSLFRPHEEYW